MAPGGKMKDLTSGSSLNAAHGLGDRTVNDHGMVYSIRAP